MSKSYTTDRHANARDRKLAKRKGRDMVVTNRSIFTIQEVIGKKAKTAGVVKHINQDGARFHVIHWDNLGSHCSEPRCEINVRRSA